MSIDVSTHDAGERGRHHQVDGARESPVNSAFNWMTRSLGAARPLAEMMLICCATSSIAEHKSAASPKCAKSTPVTKQISGLAQKWHSIFGEVAAQIRLARPPRA
jgi:hypothetical protein